MVDFFFDPGCPVTWEVSRWAVGQHLTIRWRAFSVDILDGAPLSMAQRALRVVEATWAAHGDEPIGRLYTELGTHDLSRAGIAAALDAAGLEPDLLAAADEARWDEEIRWSMAQAASWAGADARPPILTTTVVFR